MNRNSLLTAIQSNDYALATQIIDHFEDTSGFFGWFRHRGNQKQGWSLIKQTALSKLLHSVYLFNSGDYGGISANEQNRLKQDAVALLSRLIVLDGIGTSPLINHIGHLAKLENQTESIQKLKHLLAAGMPLDWSDALGQNIAHYAAEFNKVDWLNFVRAQPYVESDDGDGIGTTPLMLAVLLRRIEFATAYLLGRSTKQQSDIVNKRDDYATPPIINAAKELNLGMIALLVQSGADINDQISATHDFNWHDVARTKQHYLQENPQYDPIRRGQIYYSDNTRLMNAIVYDQWTPLMFIARFGGASHLTEVIQKYRPNPLHVTTWGRNALSVIRDDQVGKEKHQILTQYIDSYKATLGAAYSNQADTTHQEKNNLHSLVKHRALTTLKLAS